MFSYAGVIPVRTVNGQIQVAMVEKWQAPGRYDWVFPNDNILQDEVEFPAAKRILWDQTQFKVRSIFEKTIQMELSNGKKCFYVVAYVDDQNVDPKPLPKLTYTHIKDGHWFSLSNAKQKATRNEIIKIIDLLPEMIITWVGPPSKEL